MNTFLEQSLEYANQKSYLDDLFKIYPIQPDGLRTLNEKVWSSVENAFEIKDNVALIDALLKLKLFPIKDSYVSYLRKDKTAIERNPKTIARIAGNMYELGLDELWKRCSQPKETNRQMGPMFKNYVRSKALGILPVGLEEFRSTSDNAILAGSDAELGDFARTYLGYSRKKGLDFVGRFGGKYVIGEAKFLTDFGGHQNAQFEDALLTLQEKSDRFISIAILDGVLYIPRKGNFYKSITGQYRNDNIMSALLLRNFLYSL
mgnify:CR=1 FL=1